MRNLCVRVLFSISATITALSATPRTKDKLVFTISQPTVIAFFPLLTQEEVNKGEDEEALADFQFYFNTIKRPLNAAGISLYEADRRSFQIRDQGKVSVFKTGKIGIGYYFIAPGKKPRVEYSVMTDADLLDVARKYFLRPIGPPHQE